MTASPAPAGLTDEQLLAQQSRAVHRQVPASLIGGLIILSIATPLLWRDSHREVIYTWALMVVTFSLTRFLSFRRVRDRLADTATALAWLQETLWLLSAAALTWGTGLAYFLDFEDNLSVALVFCFTTALAAGAVVPLANYARCFLYYAFCLITPVAAVFALTGEFTFQMIALGLALFIAVNYRYALNIEASMQALFRSEFDNERLIRGLSAQHEELAAHRNEAVRQAQLATQANTDRARFIAAASHDLAQPMHSLGLFLDALHHAINDDEDRETTGRLVSKAEDCAANMSAMFASLLDISRIESGTVEIDRRAHEVSLLLAPVIDDIMPRVDPLPIEFDVDITPAVVDTDQKAFQRIMRNLLTNAVNHTRNGRIGISVTPRAGYVLVEIHDTGSGIPAEDLGNIFMGYYRAQQGQRGQEVGLGLGLSIVDSFCNTLDIDIDVISEVGVGTTFSLRVPAAVTAVDDSTANRSNPASAERAMPLIVVIDDDGSVREAIRLVLGRGSGQYVVASSAEEAIRKLAANGRVPGFVACDFDLEDGMNGIEAISMIRDEFNLDLPALIMTGHRSAAVRKQIDDFGVPVLMKPFSSDDLQAAVNAALQNAAHLGDRDSADG